MRSFFDRIGSRDAINWANVLVVSITQAMSSMVASDTNYDDRYLLFVACNLTAVAGLAIGLGIGALVMHKYSANKSIFYLHKIYIGDFLPNFYTHLSLMDQLLFYQNF